MTIEPSRLLDAERTEWRDLGLRLRGARTAAGMTQHAAAAFLGIGRPAISEIERGTRKVYALELATLARIYRRPVAWLLGENSDAAAVLGVQLDARDRESVLLFAEFLRHRGAARQANG